MLSAHATLAVPSKGEVELAPIGRDAIIWFLPWFIVLLVALGAAAILWRRLRPGRSRMVAPPGETPTPAEPDDTRRQAGGATAAAEAP
jgi:hypothetical protein